MAFNPSDFVLDATDIYICKQDINVTGKMLETIQIKKDSIWYLIFINDDHVLLESLYECNLTLKRDLFDLYFKKFRKEK